MANEFVQVPPNSTGNKVATSPRARLYYTGRTTGLFGMQQTVTGGTTGVTAIITGFTPTGAGAGFITVDQPSGIFSNGEDLLVNAAVIAQADTSTAPFEIIHAQENILVDMNNRGNHVDIDRFGALNTRFEDGSPTFGPFGTMATGEPHVIKSYSCGYGLCPDDWEYTSTGGGSTVYESQRRTTLISVDSANGSSAARTSHFYHPYLAGVGTAATMAMQLGDAGKVNCIQRWGMFDEDNGMFFELDGTDLSVVIRSSVSGSVVEDRYPQAEWNVDRLDGTDGIAFDLDVTAPNIYRLDFQWYGAGRVKFSVTEPSGTNITAHIVEHANRSSAVFPYTQTGTLPLRTEIINTGVTSGPSSMRIASGIVTHEHGVTLPADPHSTTSGLVQVGGTEIPILTLRTNSTFRGLDYRGILKLISGSFSHAGPLNDSPVVIRARKANQDVLDANASFANADVQSAAQIDTSAVALDDPANTTVINSITMSPQTTAVINDLSERNEYDYVIHNNRDLTPRYVVFTAQSLGGAPSNVCVTVNWNEISV